MADEKPQDAPDGGERAPVSDEELRSAYAGPAIYSNKIFLTMTGSGARITFLEQLGDTVQPVFRTAVVLSIQDALAVRDLITRQLGEFEEGLKEAIEAAKAAKSQDGE